MKSVSKKRENQFRRAAAQAGQRVKKEDSRCGTPGHQQRMAATSVQGKGPVCWECYLGTVQFQKKFSQYLAERFYKPGGPGWAPS